MGPFLLPRNVHARADGLYKFPGSVQRITAKSTAVYEKRNRCHALHARTGFQTPEGGTGCKGCGRRQVERNTLDVIDKIEEAIAGLIMQKVLVAFLQVREKGNVTSGDFVGK